MSWYGDITSPGLVPMAGSSPLQEWLAEVTNTSGLQQATAQNKVVKYLGDHRLLIQGLDVMLKSNRVPENQIWYPPRGFLTGENQLMSVSMRKFKNVWEGVELYEKVNYDGKRETNGRAENLKHMKCKSG